MASSSSLPSTTRRRRGGASHQSREASTTTVTKGPDIIHVTGSLAPLFGGSTMSNCVSVEDPTCVTGSVATAAAFARHFAKTTKTPTRVDDEDDGVNDDGAQPDVVNLVLPYLDKQSQFVQSHPLGWNVNRLIFQNYFGFPFYTTSASILVQDKRDFDVSRKDLRGLQSYEFPLLMTNAAPPSSVSWFPYVRRVYYDEPSTIALMTIIGFDDPLTAENPINALKAALDEVAVQNERSGCHVNTSPYEEYLITHNSNTIIQQQQQQDLTASPSSSWISSNSSSHNDTATPEEDGNDDIKNNIICWKPSISLSTHDPEIFEKMVEELRLHHNPPAFLFDGGNNGKYYEPTKLETPNASGAHHNGVMWIHTVPTFTHNGYYQSTIHLSADKRYIQDITWQVLDMQKDITEEILSDEQYQKDFKYIRGLVEEAQQNDPTVGFSTAMPLSRFGDYRRCKGGECPLGNLFADAIRWKARADVAFLTSGGLRGMGWDEGPVTVSQIWESLPFPNTICRGVMTGINLFRIINYSIGAATFQSKETSDGGRLIQVSGMKIVYNTELPDDNKVVRIDVWEDESQSYQPIQRLRLYKFATDSFLCGAYIPFPVYLGKHGLKLEGEVPGQIGEDLHQNIVGEYLGSLGDEYYDASIQGRLVNDTSASVTLNLIQTEEGCPPQTYWVESKATCLNCPNSSHVAFSDERLEFDAVSGVDSFRDGRILLVNREMEPFYVVPKSSPDWFQFTTTSPSNTTQNSTEITSETLLNPGDSVALDFVVSAEQLETGTASGAVSFGVLDGSGLLGCVDNNDATFEVVLRVTPNTDENNLGNMMYFGWVLMTVSIVTALGFALWTYWHKEVRMVKTMQPLFLKMICAGVVVMSLAMGSLSIDDGFASQAWCDFGCMSMPWFVSIGWTITFAAIHAKLWRINKLFNNPDFHRVVVTEKDALVAFSLLFGINFVLMLLWSLLDPLQYTRQAVPGEAWNTYGVCGSGTIGDIFMGLVVAVNVGTCCLATYQAYKARKISVEFSISKKLGLAVYTWLQVIAVALPVLFLIDREDVLARYFLMVSLIFFLCMTMVCNIFLPIIIQKKKLDKARRLNGPTKSTNLRVSGLTPSRPPNSTSASKSPRPPGSGNSMASDLSGVSHQSRRTADRGGLASSGNSMASDYSGVSYQSRLSADHGVGDDGISKDAMEEPESADKAIP